MNFRSNSISHSEIYKHLYTINLDYVLYVFCLTSNMKTSKLLKIFRSHAHFNNFTLKVP